MWAASLAFSQSQPWPPFTLPASSAKNALKTPLQFFMFRRRSLARDENHGGDKEDIAATQHKEEKGKDTAGVVGQAVLAAFNKSSAPETQRKATPQLSGSDVLRALEKASIQKTKQSGKEKSKKMGNRDSSSSSPSQGEEHVIKSLGDHAASLDQKSSSDVPLGIKSEWGIRLEELERRLRDIMLVDV